MHFGDVLGDEGRKALDACVKVKIWGRPETRRYDYCHAIQRVMGCYAGNYPGTLVPVNKRHAWGFGFGGKLPWVQLEQLLLPRHSLRDTFDIIDMHNALVRGDSFSFGFCYVEKYPRSERPDYDELKELIDKHRADVEKECEEARANPDGRCKYPWLVAQRQVRDCFAGNFAGDKPLMESNYCSDYGYAITDIHSAVVKFEEVNFCNSYRKNSCGCHWTYRENAVAQRAEIYREYKESLSPTNSFSKQALREYSQVEVEQKVKNCYCYCSHSVSERFPIKRDESGKLKGSETYNIFDICKEICHRDDIILLEKYPSSGPGSDELKKSIVAYREELEKEFQAEKHKNERKYTRSEAERRVRDCFAGNFLGDTDVFLSKGEESRAPRIIQTYGIFDIQNAIKYFDSKKLVEKYPQEGALEYDKQRESVDEQRDVIEKEYKVATSDVEIEHGSGFIIQGHFIITNRHVIEGALFDQSKRTQIFISNAVIGELPCEVVYDDVGKDLALLYCPELNLEQLHPLQLSDHPLLQGMQIFCFGYPISHTEETALFVHGFVSGSKRILSGHLMAVLNCSLNSGNSGGPVLCWINGKFKVVGVATQKHFKEILTLGERQTIEKIREAWQTNTFPEESELEEALAKFEFREVEKLSKTSMSFLTLKLYDALKTHSQFNLSNAVPGNLVIGFLKKALKEYEGECEDELAEIVKTF